MKFESAEGIEIESIPTSVMFKIVLKGQELLINPSEALALRSCVDRAIRYEGLEPIPVEPGFLAREIADHDTPVTSVNQT